RNNYRSKTETKARRSGLLLGAITKIKIPAACCGVFPQPLFARFRCKQRGIRPEEIKNRIVHR
ncbi:MAG: hypothetical protein ACYCPA_12490, partial [Acidithiobacillus sp.]